MISGAVCRRFESCQACFLLASRFLPVHRVRPTFRKPSSVACSATRGAWSVMYLEKRFCPSGCAFGTKDAIIRVGKGKMVGAGRTFPAPTRRTKVIALEPQEARTGLPVRVKEGHRKIDLAGINGTVRNRWGHPDHPALDVLLQDGRSELLWFYELDATERRTTPSFVDRLLRR
jgi:hypothetical protein